MSFKNNVQMIQRVDSEIIYCYRNYLCFRVYYKLLFTSVMFPGGGGGAKISVKMAAASYLVNPKWKKKKSDAKRNIILILQRPL